MKDYGKKYWAFAAGHIPLYSTGDEPEFTSRDQIAVLNVTDHDATIGLRIYYESSEPVHDHTIIVKARRIRKIRMNDLIDPLPIPLDTPYGFIFSSDTNVVVQFLRLDSGRRANAAFCVTPYAAKL
jgi:hypothetical protein